MLWSAGVIHYHRAKILDGLGEPSIQADWDWLKKRKLPTTIDCADLFDLWLDLGFRLKSETEPIGYFSGSLIPQAANGVARGGFGLHSSWAQRWLSRCALFADSHFT